MKLKSFACVCVVLASVGMAFGGIFDKVWIKGVTDRSPVSYKAGETMKFELTLQDVTNKLEVGAYFLVWKRTDDFGVVETGRVDLTQLPFAYSAKLDKPGFVRLEAWVTDAKGKRVGKKPFFDGGAGADVAELATEPEPEDFDAFWAKQFKRLELVPVKADLVEVKCSNPKARKFAVRIDSAGLRPVTGYLSYPKDVDAGVTYPARLFTHGYSADDCRHGTSDKAPHHEIVLDMNVHGLKLPEFGGTEADRKALRWEVRSHDCTYAFDAKQNADPEVAYFNGMVLRVKRGLQYLKTVKGWNGKELIASGGSQGGLQTIWAAACGEGVTRAESGITWCCDMAKNDLRRARKISSDGWYIPWTPSMGYYDAVNFAKRIPTTCKTIITRAGLGDYCCPPRGLAVLWNNLTCPGEIHWMQGSQHGYQPPSYDGRDWVLTR